ncbi:hypothetical protein VOLCADRAFT_103917 [Volvox carteri f. nagariensis]|uniref:Uncharacterized protein n=1 Tax=Volvox carteri f. nagariensis TaxID=3068 RepID=D8TQ24_VOLCA|nr:uncharacterized protein VOLCADRAFT_103917 [Volvox carteri f. nagariensis]EFJ50461.1 hypothetical protein VOLCADRAFT_103917 [Volvox carteri f. nagariensis]|eukprot:XP_002948586.1 hypothetical protein VOLCADRAFT_103917 [Volvox carteri f. nagariensis]
MSRCVSQPPASKSKVYGSASLGHANVRGKEVDLSLASGVGSHEVAEQQRRDAKQFDRWMTLQGAHVDFLSYIMALLMCVVTLTRAGSYAAGCPSRSAIAALAATQPAAAGGLPGGGGGGGGGGSPRACGSRFSADAALLASFPCAAGDLRQYIYTLRHLPASVLHAAVRRDFSVLLYMFSLTAALVLLLCWPTLYVSVRHPVVLTIRFTMMIGNLLAAAYAPPACIPATTVLYYMPSYKHVIGGVLNLGFVYFAAVAVALERVPLSYQLPFGLLEWFLAVFSAHTATLRTLGAPSAAGLLRPRWLLPHLALYFAAPCWAVWELEGAQRNKFRQIMVTVSARRQQAAGERPPAAAAAAVSDRGHSFGSRSVACVRRFILSPTAKVPYNDRNTYAGGAAAAANLGSERTTTPAATSCSSIGGASDAVRRAPAINGASPYGKHVLASAGASTPLATKVPPVADREEGGGGGYKSAGSKTQAQPAAAVAAAAAAAPPPPHQHQPSVSPPPILRGVLVGKPDERRTTVLDHHHHHHHHHPCHDRDRLQRQRHPLPAYQALTRAVFLSVKVKTHEEMPFPQAAAVLGATFRTTMLNLAVAAASAAATPPGPVCTTASTPVQRLPSMALASSVVVEGCVHLLSVVTSIGDPWVSEASSASGGGGGGGRAANDYYGGTMLHVEADGIDKVQALPELLSALWQQQQQQQQHSLWRQQQRQVQGQQEQLQLQLQRYPPGASWCQQQLQLFLDPVAVPTATTAPMQEPEFVQVSVVLLTAQPAAAVRVVVVGTRPLATLPLLAVPTAAAAGELCSLHVAMAEQQLEQQQQRRRHDVVRGQGDMEGSSGGGYAVAGIGDSETTPTPGMVMEIVGPAAAVAAAAAFNLQFLPLAYDMAHLLTVCCCTAAGGGGDPAAAGSNPASAGSVTEVEVYGNGSGLSWAGSAFDGGVVGVGGAVAAIDDGSPLAALASSVLSFLGQCGVKMTAMEEELRGLLLRHKGISHAAALSFLRDTGMD